MGIWLVLWLRVDGRDPVEVADLAAVFEGQRLFGPWLEGFEGYRPCQVEELRCAPVPAPDSALDARLIELGQRLGSQRDPHLLGLWVLTRASSPELLDRAIELLLSAAAQSPQDPGRLADLAAAYWIRGELGSEATDFLSALRLADRALGIDGSHRAAQFNRALALSSLYLGDEAVNAWDRLEETIADPGWREEIAARRRALELPKDEALDRDPERWLSGLTPGEARRLVAVAPETIQELLDPGLFVLWAQAEGSAQADLARSIGLLATAIESATGDGFFAVAAAGLGGHEGTDRERVAAAVLAYHQGLDTYRQKNIEQASKLLHLAETRLVGVGSPLALQAAYYRAVCTYFAGDLDEASHRFARIGAEAEALGYRRLQGHVSWMSGLLEISRGNFGDGVAGYRNAAEDLRTVGLLGRAAFVEALLADAILRLGEPQKAWRRLQKALPAAHRQAPTQERALWQRAAEISSHAGFPEISLYFHDQAVAVARRSEEEVLIAEALSARAEALSEQGRHQEAMRDLDSARSWQLRVSDDSMIRMLEAAIARVEGRVSKALGSTRGIDSLSLAIEGYTRSEWKVLLPELLLDRAELLELEGELEAAKRDLLRAVDLVEELEPDSRFASWRQSFRTTQRRMLESFIRLALIEDDRVELVRWADRLHDLEFFRPELLGKGTRDDWERRLATEIPEDTAILSWSVLEDRLVVWVLRSGAMRIESIDVPRKRLQQWVEATLGDLVRPRRQARKELHKQLIGPVATEIEGASTLVLVLDDVLGRLSFAALEDPADGSLLVERHVLVRSPAATLALRPRSRRKALPDRVFLVTEPMLSEERLAELGRLLPGAEAEGQRVLGLYAQSEVLRGAQATPEAVLRGLPKASVFHFTGHGSANPEFPEQSRLLLAGDSPERPVGLFASDLHELDLVRLEVVVLAACQAARSRWSDGAGTLSLAASFLAAGAGAVVASAEDVADRDGPEIFGHLHRSLREGASAAEALRSAQLEHLQNGSGRKRQSWAGLRVITAEGFGRAESRGAPGKRPP